MEEDIFRGGVPSFDKWTRSFNLDLLSPDERERFLVNSRTLAKNPILTWMLGRLEAIQLMTIASAGVEETVIAEAARFRLIAIRELRRSIIAFADDLTFEENRPSQKQ
jgi:hypothetical protein